VEKRNFSFYYFALQAIDSDRRAVVPMGTIMAVAAVLEIHMERNMVQIMNPGPRGQVWWTLSNIEQFLTKQ
jgi:hypothetical protein